jgi:ribosome modulation factor
MAPRPGKDTAPPANADPGHNSGRLTQADWESLWLRHLQTLRARRAATLDAKAALKAVQKLETTARNTARGDGYPLAIIDRILDDEGKIRVDLEEMAALERMMREVAGLPTGVQVNLFGDSGPRDEAWWGEDGYQAGVAGKPGVPPPECPPEFHQTWLKRWGGGQEKLAWALSEKGVNPESAHQPPAPADEE